MSDATSGSGLNIVSDPANRSELGRMSDPTSWNGLDMVDGAVSKVRVVRVANEEG